MGARSEGIPSVANRIGQTGLCWLMVLAAIWCAAGIISGEYLVLAVPAGIAILYFLVRKLFSLKSAGWLVLLIVLDFPSYITLVLGTRYSSHYQDIMRLGGLVSGGALISLGAFYAGKRVIYRRARMFESLYASDVFLLLYGIGIAVLGGLVGVIQHNNVIYLVGDTYRNLVIPLAFFLTLEILDHGTESRIEKTFELVMWVLTAIALTSLFLHLYQLGTG